MAQDACRIGIESGRSVLRLAGEWRLARLPVLERALRGAGASPASADAPELPVLDGSGLSALDTAAALLLCRWLRAEGLDPGAIELRGFDPRHERILRQVAQTTDGQAAGGASRSRPQHKSRQQSQHPSQQPSRQPSPREAEAEAETQTEPQLQRRRGALGALGASTFSMLAMLRGHVGFLGYVLVEFGRLLANPRRLRVGELVTQVARVCVSAVPVVALVTCLIGLVFAYLLGLQAQQFGANIFVVDGVAIGMTREFSPLIVSVIVAGRSGSAFAAQLGTMRLNEETDAISVLGLSVAQVLILPRVLALVLTMPLLVFVGNVAGLAGAAAIADLMLEVTPATFLSRLQDALAPRHVLIGLAKAPFFALLIAVIGCRMGMTGPRDTRTIGAHTTSTVVQGIVGVIVIDAVFAILMQRIGW